MPSLAGQIKYEHLHRYALALGLAAGKAVLDIACGEGYGAALLSHVAQSVIGVDIEVGAIEHARRCYYQQNLKFLVGSCAAIPLPDASIELITSFETIEHHDQHEEMLREIKRVLKPGGVLILSSPNRLIYSDEPQFTNPYHVKELYYDELIDLLGRHFGHVQCYGQRLATGSLVFPLTKARTNCYRAYTGDAQELTEAVCSLPSPVYFVAVCSDNAAIGDGTLDSLYLDRRDDLFKNLEAERLSHIKQLQAQLQQQSVERVAQQATYETQLTQQADELAGGRAQLASCEAELNRRTAELFSAQAQLNGAQTRLAASEARLAQQAEASASDREQLALYEAQLRQQTAALAESRAQLAAQQARSAQQVEELATARMRLASYETQLQHQAEELAKAWKQKSAYEGQLQQTEAKLIETQSQLVRKDEVLNWVHTSRAWRLAASTRRFERFAHTLRQRLPRKSTIIIQGAIETPEDAGFVYRDVRVSGWVFSRAAPITRVEAFLDEQFLGAVCYGSERPDVAAAYPDKAPVNCGFADRLPIDDTITGTRMLTVRVFDGHGHKQLYLRTIQIGRSSINNTLFIPAEVAFADSEPQPIALQTNVEPTLSVIIPVFNQSAYTFNCLNSIKDVLEHSAIKLEVIIVDDQSDDDTQKMLAQITGIRVITNGENLGFIDSCNRGAAAAKGYYLLFLNNDTLVRPHCFEELLETFRLKADAGLVGAKLFYPDGRLQEAGGIIWNDATGWNFGRLDDPEKPEYCYLREVDYCSGACIMVPRHLFQQLGGFDTRYRPAYCEDSDLAFQIRQAGYKVYYQPSAQIIHFEGITSGKDVAASVKSYQVVNQQKLFAKWSGALAEHGEPGVNPYLAKERQVTKRMLVLDACVLTPDQDAGSLTVFNHIKIFQSLGYKVTFAPDNLHYAEKYTSDLQRLGVECLYWPYTTSLNEHLKKYGSYYDIVFIARVEVAQAHISNVRASCPQAKIIFDTEDLHFVREQRQAELERSPLLARQALQRKEQELAVASKSDCTIVVSQYEKEILLKENPRLNVTVVPVPRDAPGRNGGFEERRDILFIGGFQHAPNVDAACHFVQEIYPAIKERVPDIKFYILGSKPPAEVQRLSDDTSIIVTGYIDDLAPYFNQCRLSVAPLRYGAGIKGKILTSLSYGLPGVASSIACEGIGLIHESDVLRADDPADFAASVVRLYTDPVLWDKLSLSGLRHVTQNYSIEAATQVFQQLFERFNRQLSVGVS